MSCHEADRLDRLSYLDSPAHRLDPRAKLLATLAFVVAVVSFPKYEVSALTPFVFFPLLLAGAGGIPLGLIARRVVIVSPFAIMIGLFNPLLDRAPGVAARARRALRGLDLLRLDPRALRPHDERGARADRHDELSRALPGAHRAAGAAGLRRAAALSLPLPLPPRRGVREAAPGPRPAGDRRAGPHAAGRRRGDGGPLHPHARPGRAHLPGHGRPRLRRHGPPAAHPALLPRGRALSRRRGRRRPRAAAAARDGLARLAGDRGAGR